jgi:putative spermidine/putrescine transport system ATP-binding protein
MLEMAVHQDYKLRIQAVRKSYGPVVALEDTSLEMREGEFLTLLGPSGSGKSTLLMAIAGLNNPDGGEIWIDGKLATFLPPFQRDIGMVFQNYALFPHMTIFENIAFPLRMRGTDAATIRSKVSDVLDKVQLSHVAGRTPRELSGGQQQRIALARCFVYQPSIILMDEPLGALDKKLRDTLQLEIKQLHEDLGITVLYVTHDQEEAMVMSDRICLMNNARIEQIGTPDELYHRPKTVFAADFLGESNFLDVIFTESRGDYTVATTKSGVVLSGRCSTVATPGSSARMMVRPESIRVLSDAETAENIVQGQVTDVIVAGGVTKSFVETADAKSLKVTQLTGAADGLRKGQTVRLAWAADKAVLLQDETGSVQ